jgi:hypothetical protein
MAKPATPEALFPAQPEDLTALSDEELDTLKQEFGVAADLIDANDEEFTKDIEADDLIAQYEAGVASMEAIDAEQKERVKEQERFAARKAELAERRKAAMSAEEEKSEEDEGGDEEEGGEEESAELSAEVEAEVEETEDKEDEKVEEPEVVVAAAEAPKPRLRKPPAPSADRMPSGSKSAMLVAAAGVDGARPGQTLDRLTLANTYKRTADRWGRVAKHGAGIEQRILCATASFDFPEERRLHASDWQANEQKIAAVIPSGVPGLMGMPLTAANVLCAPLEPIYSMPNFATQERPVRDALPSFFAERAGVNVPTATYVGDITSAITVIDQDDEAAGGTFNTKSCQDMSCPSYTEVAVTTISHCREYGNLNTIAWPEKIAHENDLTMAAHARSADGYLLDRIKALSLNVTNGAETLGALIYLVDAIVKSKFGIQGRLRMPQDARFRALIPFWVPDMLALDTNQTIDGNRFRSKAELVSYLRGLGIEPSFYLDTPSSGTTQLPDSAQTAAAIDSLPDNVQWAIFPEGAFIHVDSGSLELGIVRDSTLNSTNDYQFFGETFENVARLAPQQATYWVTSDLCASGQFPPAGTVRTCD